MDHNAFEKEMIDGVNRNAEEKREQAKTSTTNRKVFTEKDAASLKRGLKRTGLALGTVILFALTVFGFIATATATGYLAVALFLSSIVLGIWAFTFLYAQGINANNRGESK